MQSLSLYLMKCRSDGEQSPQKDSWMTLLKYFFHLSQPENHLHLKQAKKMQNLLNVIHLK